MIEIGKCYKNSEIFEDKNKIVGPMKGYGSMYTDDKGFIYFKDGRILDVGFLSWGANPSPDKNLIEACECEVKKGK